MKIAVVYKSVSGNTEVIAKAIREALAGEEVVYFGEPQEGIEADLYFVGSWTDKGMCCKAIEDFLQRLTGKRVAYFATAGFGGSQEYYQRLSQRVEEKISPRNQLVGTFHCQGRMPMAVRERYVQMIQEHPEDRKMQVNLENFDHALTHPDQMDEANAQAWAKSMMK